jgi:aminomethyltransferase
MSTMASSHIRQLPLHELHVKKSAKLGHFGDWEVPLYFTTILEEHDAVRTKAGLFDISHMGKFYFEGPGVVNYLDRMLPRPISPMTNGQALYMPLLNEKGGFVDDIIVYRIAPARFFIIVNAGNVAKDYDWMNRKKPQDVTFHDLSSKQGLIALQGPAAPKILEKAFPGQGFADLKYYGFKEWQGGMVARTGYTGEDGYEIMADLKRLPEIWTKLLEAGKEDGIAPIGFGARDTLRLEAGMLLYGHDMNDGVSPLEAGVSWALDLNKGEFTGRDALLTQKQKGIAKKIIGFEMLDRGIPRQDYDILKNGKPVGKVTSGSFSPTLKKNIGLGYVPVELAIPDTEIEIQVRDKALKAKVVKLPFYKRKR